MTELEAEPAERPLAKIRRAHAILRALKEIFAAAEAMEEEFWSDLDDGLDERRTEILLGLRKENDPEAAVIFSLRWQGWEICNDQELLLEEIAEFRRTMSLGEAARRGRLRESGIQAAETVIAGAAAGAAAATRSVSENQTMNVLRGGGD